MFDHILDPLHTPTSSSLHIPSPHCVGVVRFGEALEAYGTVVTHLRAPAVGDRPSLQVVGWEGCLTPELATQR